MYICSVLVIGWLISRTVLVAGSDLDSFIQNLTQRSSPWVRPVQSWDRALQAHTDLQLLAVLDVRWRDEFLSWDPSSYDGLSHFTLPASQVWTPDLFVREAVSESRQQADPFVSVSSSGWVRRSELVQLRLHCGLSLFLFPFDKQTCNITLGSYLHAVQDVLLVEETATDFVPRTNGFTLHGEWKLLSVQSRAFTEPQGEQHFSRITYQVELGRYSLYYVVNLMVPSALVLLIDLAGFAIPVESSERIPFKVTLLFGYVVFLLLLPDLLPPFRDYTPVMGLYLVVSLVFLCLSMAESVLLLALGQPDVLQRSSLIQRLATLLCRDVPQSTLLGQRAHSRRARKGLQHSYGLGRRGAELDGRWMGVATGCGCGCMLHALADELEEVSEELRTLTQRQAQRSDSLCLMEALDRLCFRIYAFLLLTFLLSIILLWALYR
ncbi:5-hydroxytryptamine receptor 3A-like [Anguilla anguilla]|uniref:5-hydroxytryptamine receptor 3A-like n=1 Tax=Anguilla anguilla TaxID=7936 RepID=UPI0015A8EEC4|nr:5-hydroxytryptamine receptor 3A-like [Anguilla anguilla]